MRERFFHSFYCAVSEWQFSFPHCLPKCLLSNILFNKVSAKRTRRVNCVKGENGKFNFHNWWSVKPRLGWTLFSFTVVKMSTKTQKKEWEAKLNILIESSMLMFMYLVATKMIDPLHTEHFLSSVKIDIWETGGAVLW